VLFADLVGFTTLSEDRDPEDTRELLTRYFEVARRIVEEHGGTIEKFIGDAVMAVWGAPTAHEDDAERAVRAALAIVAGVSSIGDGETPLNARAAVLTGEAAVNIGAEGQGMVAGDLVNTASRLQSAAQPGTVLVGEATYRAASNAISFEPAGEQHLKGKAAPVPAWRAGSVVARRGGGGRASTLEPPFVGREDELQQLKDLFDATGRERKPRLVTVIGQAGIGKSRLAWEFEKYLDGVVETAYWHEGRTPAYGEGVSYWALAEMVRLRAGIAEGEDPLTARPKVAAMLEDFLEDPAERRWVEPRLAGLLGLAELPSEGREELFSAWRTLFERIAARAPTVLVFVDLHWADQGLLDFVEDLLSWARSSPIFVVALARPELLERRPEWGTTVRSVTRINLEPLEDAEMRGLLEGLLPGLPANAVRSIVERAEGIPLYAVETVRMLLDTGGVVPDGDHYVPKADLSQLAVAETLQALIAARLDANTPEDRSLIQDAAVLGLAFTVESLAAVNGRDEPQLGPVLERLTRRQLLVPDNDPRSPERGQYRFVQALVREVAYQSLAHADRRTRHLAAARYFEARGDEELAGVLATHYLDAFRASHKGPEADALAGQARISLEAAAERATALHSHRQAMAYHEQALSVADDPAEQAAIRERAGQSAEYAGLLEIAIHQFREAASAYRGLGDRLSLLRASTLLGRVLLFFHHEDEALSVLKAAVPEAEPLGEVPELGATFAELGRAYMLRNEFEDAITAADRALSLGSRLASPTVVVEAMVTKGTSLDPVGRLVEALAVLRGAIAVADQAGLIAASLRARNNLFGLTMQIDVGAAETLAREGYEMATRFGHRAFLYQFLWNLAEIGLKHGDWDAWLEERSQLADEVPLHPYYQVGFEGQRSVRLALRGERDAAQEAYERAVAGTKAIQTTQVVYTELSRGWLLLVDGDLVEAVHAAERAATDMNFMTDGLWLAAYAAAAGGLTEELDRSIAGLTSQSDGRPLVAGLEGAARAARAARSGELDAARIRFADAMNALDSAGSAMDRHLVGLLWGALLADQQPEAAAAASEAEEFFSSRGASSFVRAYREAFVRREPGAESATTEASAEQVTPARAEGHLDRV
jgi:class 3 adenylate cyclase/tetratricopeptide (TPR) repeat protein